jgi:hypothetical protein
MIGRTKRARLCQRVTLPALRQDVHTLRRFGVPPTTTRTRWMFGLQRRLVFFFDQGTLWPNPGLLPHTSHTAATGVRSLFPSCSRIALLDPPTSSSLAEKERLGSLLLSTAARDFRRSQLEIK